MKKKRFLILMLIFMMLTLLLFSCGKCEHKYIMNTQKDATCTEDGLTSGVYCKLCNEILIEQTVISKTGHTEAVDMAVAATCTEDGLTEGSHCTVCNEIIIAQEKLPKSHTAVIDEAVPATCTKDGLTEGSHCTVCNEIIIAQEKLPKSHTAVIDEAVPATCTKDGLTEGSHCSWCGEVLVAQIDILASHKDADGDEICDVCMKSLQYDWDETQLLFQMTKNSNQNELSSCCERYLAGEWDGDTDDLDILIAERNAATEIRTNVSVRYNYYHNTNEYGWSNAVLAINEQVSSSSVKDIPDMFCNFTYDMVAASLNSNFANLLSSTRGANYFEFVKSDYIPEGEQYPAPENDKGYMYEYMCSTTLSNTKMYILASDYFTDVVRAFFVTPVNIALLQEVGADITGDLNGDGRFTVDDFYISVKNNEWTYALVAAYSNAVYNNAPNETNLTLNGTVGFALPVGGLPASGILYSNNIDIIKGGTALGYEYPKEQDDLKEMAAALGNLMNKPGVISVVSDDISKQYSMNGNPLLAVRTRFCDNYVLFGGVECLGALDGFEYQELNTNTGFGIVPVPVYKSATASGESMYRTSVHNVARVGAIARTTTKFSQCTAFLNYQSTHSDEILNTYYETRLQYGAAGGETGTVDMLNFIRDNVGSAFDKTAEDAIGYKYSTDNLRWHSCFSRDGYNCNIIEDYNKSIGQKKDYLTKLQASYDNYPD